MGEFKDGQSSGQGTYKFKDGRKYVGEFRNDNYNGQGIFYSANGSIKESGIYKDNVLVTSQYIDPNSFTRIAINNPAPAVSDSQRQEADQLKAQLEAERRFRREAEDKVRLSQESNQVKPNSTLNVAMGKRIALVIGNAKYLSSPLRNPINDANDMSNALKQSGFEVIDVRDANLQQMTTAVRTFGDRLLNSEIGLVYYAGHGIESNCLLCKQCPFMGAHIIWY